MEAKVLSHYQIFNRSTGQAVGGVLVQLTGGITTIVAPCLITSPCSPLVPDPRGRMITVKSQGERGIYHYDYGLETEHPAVTAMGP